MKKYQDIIHLKRPVSKKHQPMSIENRAAQFSSFAALSGYEEMILESERYVERKMNLSEYQINEINLILNLLKEKINELPLVEITYFIQDNLKKGGIYKHEKNRVKKIIENEMILVLMDKKINFDDIWKITIVKND